MCILLALILLLIISPSTRQECVWAKKLADQILREWGEDHGIDVVIPIPDTSRNSALELAVRLNVKYREGFNKNRYIGRTFIMPGQQQRKKKRPPKN